MSKKLTLVTYTDICVCDKSRFFQHLTKMPCLTNQNTVFQRAALCAFTFKRCDTKHVHYSTDYSTGHLRPLVQAHLTSTTCCFPRTLTLCSNLFIGKGFIDLNRPQPFCLPWTACGSPRGLLTAGHWPSMWSLSGDRARAHLPG